MVEATFSGILAIGHLSIGSTRSLEWSSFQCITVWIPSASFPISHPAFASDPSLGDLNAGFLDQIEALRWVQRHISAFGGDPNRVTINGQSAGGSSVELHLVSSGSDGLFHAAISQSVFRVPLPTPQQQGPLFDHYAAEAGCGSGFVAEKMTCLRGASVSALARAQDSSFNGSYNAFHPVLDGKLILELPTVSILNGRFRKVPLLVGATSNETLSGGTIPSALKSFFPGLSDQDLTEFEQEYSQSAFSSNEEQFRTATGESELRCARQTMASAFSKKTVAFAYRYNQANPTSGSPIVEHAAENWMMFRGTNTGFNGTTTFTPMTPIEEAFAEELIAYWLSFVRLFNPNTFKLARSPIWPSYHDGHPVRIVLQQGSGSPTTSGNVIEAEPTAELARCAFVAGKVEAEQN